MKKNEEIEQLKETFTHFGVPEVEKKMNEFVEENREKDKQVVIN